MPLELTWNWDVLLLPPLPIYIFISAFSLFVVVDFSLLGFIFIVFLCFFPIFLYFFLNPRRISPSLSLLFFCTTSYSLFLLTPNSVSSFFVVQQVLTQNFTGQRIDILIQWARKTFSTSLSLLIYSFISLYVSLSIYISTISKYNVLSFSHLFPILFLCLPSPSPFPFLFLHFFPFSLSASLNARIHHLPD